MLLLNKDKSVRFVSRSSPLISLMLLNERSSHFRLHNVPRFSMSPMMLLSNLRVAKLRRLSRFWILKMF